MIVIEIAWFERRTHENNVKGPNITALGTAPRPWIVWRTTSDCAKGDRYELTLILLSHHPCICPLPAWRFQCLSISQEYKPLLSNYTTTGSALEGLPLPVPSIRPKNEGERPSAGRSTSRQVIMGDVFGCRISLFCIWPTPPVVRPSFAGNDVENGFVIFAYSELCSIII